MCSVAWQETICNVLTAAFGRCGARGPRAQKRNLPRGRSAVSCLTSPITHSVTSVFEVDILYDCSITLYIWKFVEELFKSYRFLPFNPTNSVRNPSMTPRTSCYSISCMSCPTSVHPAVKGHDTNAELRWGASPTGKVSLILVEKVLVGCRYGVHMTSQNLQPAYNYRKACLGQPLGERVPITLLGWEKNQEQG